MDGLTHSLPPLQDCKCVGVMAVFRVFWYLCAFMHACACVCSCVSVCVHACFHGYVHTCVHACVLARIRMYVHVCVHAGMYEVHTYMCISLCVCVYLQV